MIKKSSSYRHRSFLDELIQKDPPVTFRQARNNNHLYWENLARSKKQDIIDLVGENACDKAINDKWPEAFNWQNCYNMMTLIYDKFVKELCEHKEFYDTPGATHKYICKECAYQINTLPEKPD